MSFRRPSQYGLASNCALDARRDTNPHTSPHAASSLVSGGRSRDRPALSMRCASAAPVARARLSIVLFVFHCITRRGAPCELAQSKVPSLDTRGLRASVPSPPIVTTGHNEQPPWCARHGHWIGGESPLRSELVATASRRQLHAGIAVVRRRFLAPRGRVGKKPEGALQHRTRVKPCAGRADRVSVPRNATPKSNRGRSGIGAGSGSTSNVLTLGGLRGSV
jgi:hypothetical protein